MGETRVVDRKEDMSQKGFLRLFLQPDGDVIVAVTGEDMFGRLERSASVEFCTSGGRSHRTLKALYDLMRAMAEDNNDPHGNFTARHENLGEWLVTRPAPGGAT